MARFWRTAALLAAMAGGIWGASSARADGLIVIKADLARPARNRHFTYAPLSVTSHKVNIAIAGQLAVTEIEQDFYNETGEQLEGDYLFPVPEGAEIDKFSMDVNGEQTPADVIDSQSAAAIYESIVRPPMGNGRDPALMEYVGRKMYKCRIFPLEPHKKKTVKISYTQLLKKKDGLLDYHYGLNSTRYSRKPIQDLSIALTVAGDEPLSTLYSPTHMVDVKRDGANRATVTYRAQDVRPTNDFHLFIGRKSSPVGLSVLTYRPRANEDGYFVLMASPTVDKTNVTLPRDVIFVVDTSGSMAGVKMRQARQALDTCIASLKPADRFDIIRFSTQVEPMFKKLAPANEESRKQAQEFIRGLNADGETALEPALTQALSQREMQDPKTPAADRLFMVVFVTDGEPTNGEVNPDKILAKFVNDPRAANVRVHTFGIGTQVNTRLLDDLALNTQGQSNYVLEHEDIAAVVGGFFKKVQDPVLTQMKLQADGATFATLYPTNVPDMFIGDQMVIFGRYHKAGQIPVTLAGKTASGKQMAFAETLNFPAQTDTKNAWVGRLWATRRVGALLDRMQVDGTKDLYKSEVAQLARQFGIVTPYTAMIIVEKEQRARLPLAYHTLGDLENDAPALERAGAYFGALVNQKFVGDRALANAINTNSYRMVTNLEQLARVVEQREARLRDPSGADRGGLPALARTQPELQVDWNLPDAREQYEKQRKELLAGGALVYDNYAAMNRLVGDRAFFLSRERWVDAALADAGDAPTVTLKFASPAYMALARAHRELSPVLALGKNVTFVFDGKVYEISE